LNLALGWFLTKVDPDVWKNEFAPIFDRTSEDDEREKEVRSRWSGPDEHGRGEFRLDRKDVPDGSGLNFAPADS